MRALFHINVLFILFYIWSCANQGTPTGGPKDTIPPTLTQSLPQDKSINYTQKEFQFYFDERINADNLQQELVITPLIENPYKFKYRKNFVTIKFENDFDSATTYTLNFANGIVDVTEKNPPLNFKLAFSTGPIIDSIFVSGQVIDLFKNEIVPEAVVSLYHISDTLDLLTGRPRYFTKTDEEGNFLIENIKDGYYKIYAFLDANGNLINQPQEEPHAFLKDSLDLSTSRSDLILRTQLLDITPLKFNRGKFTGIYFDLEYNKYLEKYKLQVFHNPLRLPVPANNLVANNTTIRMYYDSAFRYDLDSLGFLVTAFDTLQNNSTDTVFVKFRSSRRKPATFSSQLTPTSFTKIEKQLNAKIVFDKPIKNINLDSTRLSYDTLFYRYLPDSIFKWNINNTTLQFSLELDQSWFSNKLDSLRTLYADTTNKDSIYQYQRTYLASIDSNKFDLVIPKSSFISVENDSSQLFTHSYAFKQIDDYGTVSGQVITDETSYILQLVSPEYNVIQELNTPKKYKFRNIPQGKYTFRVLIDSDQNGKYNYGNLYRNEAPEPIFFYDESFDLRANWQLEKIDIQF